MSRLAWLLIMIAASAADAAPAVEIGGFGGLTSSKTRTHDCTMIHLGAGDPCPNSFSEPHYSETGIAAGLYIRRLVHPAVLVEADLTYTQKGVNGGPNGTDTTYHYIEAPLLVRVDPLRASSRTRVFALAGLAPAVRIACTVSGPIFDNDAHMAVDYAGSCADLAPPLNRSVPKAFDLGLVIGAGVGWSLSAGQIEVQARYTHGLIDMQDNDGGKTINRALYLLVGYGRAFGS